MVLTTEEQQDDITNEDLPSKESPANEETSSMERLHEESTMSILVPPEESQPNEMTTNDTGNSFVDNIDNGIVENNPPIKVDESKTTANVEIRRNSLKISNPEPTSQLSEIYDTIELQEKDILAPSNEESLLTTLDLMDSSNPSDPPKEPLSANTLDEYHPPYMYCGECTACSAAPPPLNPSLFQNEAFQITDNDDDDDDHNDNNDTEKDIEEGKMEDFEELEMTALDTSKASIPKNLNTAKRSKFLIKNLTDPSQILAINALLRPLPGVSKILANASKQLILVDHDPFTTPASLITLILTNQGGFKVECKWDAGSSIQNTANPSGTCRSVLRVMEGLCCNSEVPILTNILENMKGVEKVKGVNLTIRSVYLEHDPFVVTVSEICDKLTEEGFRSIVKRDGAKQLSRKAPSKDDIETFTKATPLSPSSLQENTYVETTLRVGYLSTLEHVKAMERVFQSANSERRQQTGKKRMIRAFHPHPPSKTVKVEHDAYHISALDLAVLLSNDGGAGAVEVQEDGAAAGRIVHMMEEGDDMKGDESEVGDDHFVDSVTFSVLLSGIFWLLSMMTYFGGRWDKLKYCGLLSVVFGLPPIAKKAFRTIRRRQFDANCMMLTAALGALLLQEYDEAASVAFLFAISELLEARASSRARHALSAIINIRPDSANVVDPDTKEITLGVPSEKVPIGSIVSVRTGDKVPCDGIVVDGSTLIDESSLTGEARPAHKKVGDEVSGGTINIGQSQLLVKTTVSVEESAVSRLIALVEEAQLNRSPTEKLVDSFAKKYTPVVVFMASFMCTIPWIWGTEVGKYWALNGLIIIVVACPCALTISTPVTYSAGLAATAQQGVIVKGGARLEALGRVQKVVFDKTGTLTKGKFELTNLLPVGGNHTRKQILELLVVMEAPSSHPLSSTLVQAAKNENISIPKDLALKDHTVLQGEGVMGVVNGKTVHVGNYRLFQRLGYYQQLSEEDHALFGTWNATGGTVGFIGKEGEGIIGVFCVMDSVREESAEVVKAMQEYGIEVIMLTGDSVGAANNIGHQVGLDESQIHSQLRPDDKLHFVGSLKGSRGASGWCKDPNLILMCGDGVNDAPALAVSDIGVAMGSGAALALEMSDVTLMDSNLKKLFFSIKMGKRAIWAIEENILFSLVTKMLVVGFTFAGWMTLFGAIATDVGVMLAVTLNGMKLLPSNKTSWEDLVEGDKPYRKIFRRKRPVNREYLTLPLEGNAMEEIV